MAERNQRCRMLERHKYWTEFEPTRHQFFKIILGDFRDQLVIPKKFVQNFRQELSGTILLIGPSGHVWPVTVTRTPDDVLLQNGWGSFVQDHSLEVANFLIFRYNGNCSFTVTIFDMTGCEREGSYFVRKHKHLCSSAGCALEDEDRVEVETNREERNVMRGSGSRMQKGKIQTTDQVDKIMIDESSEEGSESSEEEEEHRSGQAHTDVGGPLDGKLDEKGSYCIFLLSNRRQVSKEEKQMALRSAKEHSSGRPSFMKHIKKEWAMEHIPSGNNLLVQLRVPPSEMKWPVWVKNNHWKTAFGKGWFKFVEDNNLEVDDVCIFELRQGGKACKGNFIIDVLVFRVVNEVVPLARLTKPVNKQ